MFFIKYIYKRGNEINYLLSFSFLKKTTFLRKHSRTIILLTIIVQTTYENESIWFIVQQTVTFCVSWFKAAYCSNNWYVNQIFVTHTSRGSLVLIDILSIHVYVYIYVYTHTSIYYRIRFELSLWTNINPNEALPSRHYLEYAHCSYAKNIAQHKYYEINPLAARSAICQKKKKNCGMLDQKGKRVKAHYRCRIQRIKTLYHN